MMVTNENYEKPAHVPDDFFVPGNIWEAMGDRPHDRLQQIAKGREMIFLQTHQIPGHSPQGTWLAGSARVARQILLDSATFSSNNVTGFARLLGNDLIYFPVDVDPPAHTKYRALIAKHFMPASVSALREVVRSRIDTLLDGIIAKGGCEFVAEFAKVLPATIFLDLVGLPRERADDFLKWADVSLCAPTPQERIAAMVCIRDYLASEIECRQKDPRNDILSALTNGEIDGRRLEFREALGGAMILYIAGLDTVAGQLGWIFRHLAEDTELQMSLRRDPSRLAKVNEEFIRFFSSVCFSRRATKDVEIGGVTVRKGDSVTCSTTMCGRDSTEFKDADRLDVSQQPRRHMAFGFGIHNCIGLHLARLEINLATERWLERVPEFRIAEGASTPSHGGSFIALDSLPIVCRGPFS